MAVEGRTTGASLARLAEAQQGALCRVLLVQVVWRAGVVLPELVED